MSDSEQLALLGGTKTIPDSFPPFNTIGAEEREAATQVIDSGCLSGFFGSWSERFYGGPKVREFEKAWAELFESKHAISFNSWTSGLIAAVGALDIEPGDEIIVSPWTMTASATAILVWNAIPVFADIEADTFNLDPASVEKNITPRTKAIMVPDIFGQSADLDAIMDIADRHGLKVIEDAAQAPLVRHGDRYVGTIGHIGGYSLNCHKHIHTGEGGVAVTDDDDLAERMRLIRNHGEAVVGPKGVENIANILGFNFRLGEIEAAMGVEQLKKLPSIVKERVRAGAQLSEGLLSLRGLKTPFVREGCEHACYIYAMTVDESETGVSRDRLVEALSAEGVPWVYGGYCLLHQQPMYQRRIAYGTSGFPWGSSANDRKIDYRHGICPTAEDLHERTLTCLQIGQHHYTEAETAAVVRAFQKVWRNLDALKNDG